MHAPERTTGAAPHRGGRPGPREPGRHFTPGSVVLQPQRTHGSGERLRRLSRVLGVRGPDRGLPSVLSTYRDAGWRAGVSGVARLVHLRSRGPGMTAGRGALVGGRAGADRAEGSGVRPAGRESAPFVRVTELWVRAAGSPRWRPLGAGCDHLGRRCPLPRGAVVSPLKKPALHCSPAVVAGVGGALPVREGGRNAQEEGQDPASEARGKGPRSQPGGCRLTARTAVLAASPSRDLWLSTVGIQISASCLPDSQLQADSHSETRTNGSSS